MKTFTKKYQVWCQDPAHSEAYIFIEYDTLAECISSPKLTNDWYITKRVSLSVTEAETEPNVTRSDNTVAGTGSGKDKPSDTPQRPVEQKPVEPTAEEIAQAELAARYTGGPVGQVG